MMVGFSFAAHRRGDTLPSRAQLRARARCPRKATPPAPPALRRPLRATSAVAPRRQPRVLASVSSANEPSPLDAWCHKGSRWSVREVKREKAELKQVAALQALCFHESNPINVLNDLFLSFFRAEVYDALLTKAKYISAQRFAALVVTAVDSDEIVGVVELSMQGEAQVKSLLNLDEYLYLCCMAVEPSCRRQSVASDLLQAAEHKAREWGHEVVSLHVHTSNQTAREVYERAGYNVLAIEPAFTTTMVGRPRRILMVKDL